MGTIALDETPGNDESQDLSSVLKKVETNMEAVLS